MSDHPATMGFLPRAVQRQRSPGPLLAGLVCSVPGQCAGADTKQSSPPFRHWMTEPCGPTRGTFASARARRCPRSLSVSQAACPGLGRWLARAGGGMVCEEMAAMVTGIPAQAAWGKAMARLPRPGSGLCAGRRLLDGGPGRSSTVEGPAGRCSWSGWCIGVVMGAWAACWRPQITGQALHRGLPTGVCFGAGRAKDSFCAAVSVCRAAVGVAPNRFIRRRVDRLGRKRVGRRPVLAAAHRVRWDRSGALAGGPVTGCARPGSGS